jgi:glutamate racemase
MAAHGQGLRVLLQACPGLVEQVELAALDDAATLALLRTYVEPLLAQGADTLVLGCTHYPFLREAIQKLAGPHVRLIDPAPAVAQQLARRLQADGLARRAPAFNDSPPHLGTAAFWTSGSLAQAQHTMAALWQGDVVVQALPAA